MALNWKMRAGERKVPSTIASHIYTMLALAAVGTLLVATVHSYTAALKATAEVEQLKNILAQVAAKGVELVTVTLTTNSSARAFLQLPSAIGYQQYWLRAHNDSSKAWIEGCLGTAIDIPAPYRVFLPKETSASGYFIGGYGSAQLESHFNGSSPQLKLSILGG